MVHYILVEGQIFLSAIFSHISKFVLDIIAYPGEFGLHCIILVSQLGPSFSEKLQLLILPVDQQLMQMHVEIMEFLHKLWVLSFCPF